MSTTDFLTNIHSFVEAMVEKHAVPALSVAVWRKDQLYKAAAGMLNLETGVEVNVDSLFHIGSITKVFTASLIMQLVDEGRVELDKPVKLYLRDFRVADEKAAETVTVRQLLSHTNGLAGDFIPNEAHAEGNAIARYVDRCSLLTQIHAPGEHFSYSNSAYAIAGRLIEVMFGMTWQEAVEERIYQPLGMMQAVARATDVLRFRVAMGHLPNGDNGNSDKWMLSPTCYSTCMGAAPAGALTMSASDLVKFAVAHLHNGKSESGETWLSEESIRTMQASQVQLPSASPFFITDWGLGWALMNSEATPIFGHDGFVAGQLALLRIVPEHNIVLAIQQNCADVAIYTVLKESLAQLTGVELNEREPLQDPIDPVKLKGYTGFYKTVGHTYEIVIEDGSLVLIFNYDDSRLPPAKSFLKPLGENCFAVYSKTGQREHSLEFLNLNEQGAPTHMFSGLRLCSRI